MGLSGGRRIGGRGAGLRHWCCGGGWRAGCRAQRRAPRRDRSGHGADGPAQTRASNRQAADGQARNKAASDRLHRRPGDAAGLCVPGGLDRDADRIQRPCLPQVCGEARCRLPRRPRRARGLRVSAGYAAQRQYLPAAARSDPAIAGPDCARKDYRSSRETRTVQAEIPRIAAARWTDAGCAGTAGGDAGAGDRRRRRVRARRGGGAGCGRSTGECRRRCRARFQSRAIGADQRRADRRPYAAVPDSGWPRGASGGGGVGGRRAARGTAAEFRLSAAAGRRVAASAARSAIRAGQGRCCGRAYAGQRSGRADRGDRTRASMRAIPILRARSRPSWTCRARRSRRLHRPIRTARR